MRLPWAKRDGRCATCGHLAVRQEGTLISADLAYRVDAKSRLPSVPWNSAWCQREAANLSEEAKLAWLKRGGMALWEQRSAITAPQAQPEDYLVVMVRDRACPTWLAWVPGKSLEEHSKMADFPLGTILTVFGLLIAAAGVFVTWMATR